MPEELILKAQRMKENLVLILVLVLLIGCIENPPAEKPIGGERDEHGCLGPAGYTWNEDIGACIRKWKLNENQRRAAEIAVAPLSYPVTITKVDVARCPGCFVVHIQRNDNQEKLRINLENWQIVEKPVTCPEDARICSDGSVAVRIPPECEFAPCPDKITIKEEAEEFCDDENVGVVSVCDDYIRVISKALGAGSKFHKSDGTEIQCPVVAPDAMTEECRRLIFDSDCEEVCSPEKPIIGDMSTVVEANNEFALDLYHELKNSEDNIFYSPWSLLTALVMTYEGARGQTADEMQKVLYLPQEDEIRRSSFGKIQTNLNEEKRDYELYTANALWPQKDYLFLESYMNVIRTYYDGEVTSLDYVTETEKSRQTINSSAIFTVINFIDITPI